jgi:oligoribonuclease
MNKDHTIFVIDLETTGLDPANDMVIEVAALAVNDGLEVVNTFHSIVTEAAVMSVIEAKLHPKARVMHEESGLLQELREEYARSTRTTAPADVEQRLLDFLRRSDMRPGQVMFTGYSSQFDQRFVERAMPMLHWVCTYQMIEIGSVRRVFNLAGFKLKKWEVPNGRVHRALDDAMTSLNELRSLRDLARIAHRFSSAEGVPSSVRV